MSRQPSSPPHPVKSTSLRQIFSLALLAAACLAAWTSVHVTPVSAASLLGLRGSLDAINISTAGLERTISATSLTFGLPWRNMLLVVHVLGLTIGFGSALFLDFFLLRRLYSQPVNQATVETMAHGERLAAIGLALLWMSGLGFLLFYYLTDPAKLDNPKLWAKLAIVCLLTLNGILIHAVVSPRLAARIGRPLLKGLPLAEAAVPLAAAAISGVSWATAAMLGLLRELNGIAPGGLILVVYLGLITIAFCAAASLHLVLGQGTVQTMSSPAGRR